jgi:hypothetical protein
VLAQAGWLAAEPLVLEQAGNVLKQGTLEAGLADISYQTDETKITDSAGDVAYTITRTVFNVPLYARYAFTPSIEAFLNIPYSSVSQKTELTGSSSSESDAGLADPTVAGKYSFAFKSWDLAAAAFFTLPAGKDSTDMPSSFKRGLAIKPLLAARKGFGDLTFNANLSYTLNSEYTDENDVKQKYGDVLNLGAGVEYPVKNISGLLLIGEAFYNSLGEAKSAGEAQSGTSGSQYDIVIGGRYNTGNWKTKLGLDLSLGEEKYRAYDYRIIAGVSYLVSL